VHRLVIALTSLLTLVGAGVVGLHLFLSGRVADPAANLVPAESQLYVSVYLEPSPAQRANLAALLGRLPGFGDQAALDTKIDQIATNLLSQAGIDYQRDLRPWLGNQVAIGLATVSPDAAEPEGIVVFGVRDREEAEEALPRLAATGGGGELREVGYEGTSLFLGTDGGGYAFVGEMLAVGSSDEQLRAAVDAGNDRRDSLADSEAFRRAMAALPPDHLASLYLDVTAVAEAAGAPAEQVRGLSTLSAALIAEERGIRLAGQLPVDRSAMDPAAAAVLDASSAAATLPGWMPPDTTAAISLFGLAGALEAAEESSSEASSIVAQLRTALIFGLGLSLDDDILPLLGGEVGLAITGLPAEGGIPSGQLLLRPADPSVVEPTLERLRDALQERGAEVSTSDAAGTTITTVNAPQLGAASYAITDGVIIVGLTPEDVSAAVQARADGSTLADSEPYTTAFAAMGRHAGAELFLDLQALLALAGELGADTGQLEALPADARAILERIEAFAFSSPATEHGVEIHAVITVR
jgi:hypothetical protein